MIRLFSKLRDWQERRQVLREIGHMRADVNEQVRFKVRDELTYALAGLDRGDHRYATEVWTSLLGKYPEVARASRLALDLLLRLRRFDEAEGLMRQGRKTHPNDPYFAIGLARVAHQKRDFSVANELWAATRKRFPGVIEAYARGAEALAAIGRFEEAESLTVQAMERFPDDLSGFLEYARAAVRNKDWEQALLRWTVIMEKFGFAGSFVGAAQALTQLGRFDEADQILLEVRLRSGIEASPHCEFARVAEGRGDKVEAVKRWNAALYRFPLDIHVHLYASEAFERLDDPAEAEATLKAAVERFQTEPRPLLELAKLYHFRRRDYPAAAEAWAKLREAFPDLKEAYTSGADALQRANRSDEAEALRAELRRRFPEAA